LHAVANCYDLPFTSILVKVTLWDQQGENNQDLGVTIVHIRNGKIVFVEEFIFDLNASFFPSSQPV